MQIYNTLSKTKEPLSQLNANALKMYVCGVTVYDRCHIGHARVYTVFDSFVRYLRSRGVEVTYVRNITDIDDKIIAIANERGIAWNALTESTIALMHQDFAKLGILPPDIEPRATESVPEIIEIVTKLIDRGLAYAADNGDVYYSVAKFEGYGKLSGRKLEDMRAGERVEVNPHKTDPMDFVLWKASKPNEPSWESPWGPGRPGWHIECSAMVQKHLGLQIDLHGGGEDLPFPHHENEIAQSEGAHGCCFSNQWMHIGFVRLNDEKMSKSTGNYFTIADVLAEYHPEVVRYFLLSAHYRSQINYTLDQLAAAKSSLASWYTALDGVDAAEYYEPTSATAAFSAALDDDFNTALAISEVHQLAAQLNRAKRDGDRVLASALAAEFRALTSILGLVENDADAFAKFGADDTDVAAIESLIAERVAARENKDWARSDELRDKLNDMGVVLEDKGGETIWRKR